MRRRTRRITNPPHLGQVAWVGAACEAATTVPQDDTAVFIGLFSVVSCLGKCRLPPTRGRPGFWRQNTGMGHSTNSNVAKLARLAFPWQLLCCAVLRLETQVYGTIACGPASDNCNFTLSVYFYIGVWALGRESEDLAQNRQEPQGCRRVFFLASLAHLPIIA